MDGLTLRERAGTAPQINRNIQNLAFNHSHEFSLCLFDLIVQSAQYILRRAGVVVLHKSLANAQASKHNFVVALQKESALVPEHAWFQDEYIRERCRYFLDRVHRTPRCSGSI